MAGLTCALLLATLMTEEVRDNIAAHRFELVVDRHLSFSEYTLDGDVITFTHTIVPPALEGMAWPAG